ncbi:MAG: T9SS type A sorting domain-containing protein [Rhodothermus sp.]|nr:T9SS type A sorting domain-containing protein [Rhodothermus sp.]
MKRLCYLLAAWLVTTASAQDLVVVATNPSHGSVGVDPATPVSITFNKAIVLDSLLIFPLDSTLQSQLGPETVQLSDDGQTITFIVTHNTDQDYTWIVHYVKAADGSRLAAPFTFFYTTAAEAGPHTISGQLVEAGAAKHLPPPPAFMHSRTHNTPLPSLIRPSEPSPLPYAFAEKRPSSLPTVQSGHLGGWYVALFATPNAEGDPLRLAVTDPAGNFSIDYVRPGLYFLWAFRFGTIDQMMGFGTLDANGDGESDSLQVAGDISGLVIPVVILAPTTAQPAAAAAQLAFSQVAADAQVVFLMGAPDSTGQSLFWYVVAYSSSQQTAYALNISGGMPIGAPQPLSRPEPFDQMAPIDLQNMKDSDFILNSFLTTFPSTGAPRYRQMMAGQLFPYVTYNNFIDPALYPLPPTEQLWFVQEVRPLPAPLIGTADYSGVYGLTTGNELLTTQPVTARAALGRAWSWATAGLAKRVQQADGIVEFSAADFNPYNGKASRWQVGLVAGGQPLLVVVEDTLITRVDTLTYVTWPNDPKLPYPDIFDSDQAADTMLAYNAASLLETQPGPFFSLLEGGLLASRYPLNVDLQTPLYGLTLQSLGSQAGKQAAPQIAQVTARYFTHMVTGEFVGSTVELPHTARARLQTVEDSARAYASNAELKRIWSHSVDPFGIASDWTYDYYAPADSAQLEVTATPVEVSVTRLQPPEIPLAAWPTLPEPFVDSDQAMSVAMANGGSQFMADHPEAMIFMEGRAMPDRYPHLEGRYIWEVRFQVPAGQGAPKAGLTTQQQDSLIVLIDMQTGEVLPVAVSNEPLPEIARLQLESIYPNPASRQVSVIVQVPKPERLRLSVYNLLGQEVARLLDGLVAAGTHHIRWIVADLPSGLYFLRLEGSQHIDTRSLVVAH